MRANRSGSLTLLLLTSTATAAPVLANTSVAVSVASAAAAAAHRSLRQAPQQQTQRPDPNYRPPDPMAIATWRNSGHDTELHDESEIEPEDYLWQNLPGRCCFSGHWDNKQKGKDGGPKWVGVNDCSQCDIWGQPDATCHNSKGECTTCGMDLYCEGQPPPLLGGAKTCTGASRIGEGCFDMLKMGVCMAKDLNDCMTHCHHTENCEMVIYYTQEMKGSCTLCSDLTNVESTPHQTTRIYARRPPRQRPATTATSWTADQGHRHRRRCRRRRRGRLRRRSRTWAGTRSSTSIAASSRRSSTL